MNYYTLYLDESKFKSKSGNFLYSIAGVAIPSASEPSIRNSMNQIKTKIWSRDLGYSKNEAKMNIFHESEIRSNNSNLLIRRPTYEVFVGEYKNKNLAISGIGNIINQYDLDIFGLVVDQTSINENYSKYVDEYEAYNIALKVIIENFVLFLKKKSACGELVLESRQDDNSDILDLRTKKMINKIIVHGTSVYSALDIQKSFNGSKFRCKKENVPGLQIADFIPRPLLLAYANAGQSKPSIYKMAIRKHRYNAGNTDGATKYGVVVKK
ncbi:DUF3800 domain-containing protein [Fructobacillus ficulneus]|uniref:DUF3800 domain-containing protein n=1 Tax=Fructobacillus ficulneus TaxID=157463 RepID=A0A0K8MIW3_9LACO|nr:DUF3800 domain-containing protein [Fructobacillus ficulneus]GAP00119.1 hypothetical protein FFIC_281250 [Fructobacillus ficulneus]